MGKGWTDTGYFTIVSNFVLEDTELSARARFLYTILVRYGRWKRVSIGAETQTYLVAWVSRPKLAELMGESDWSISQYLRELINRDLIERKRRPGGSSLTYICDPRPIYAEAPEIPEDEAVEHPDPIEAIELLDSPQKPQSLAPAHDDVCPSTRRSVPQPTTGIDGITQEMPSADAEQQTAEPEKDVAVEEDIAILSDNSRASHGIDGPDRNSDEDDAGEDRRARARKSRLYGLLGKSAESKLTNRPVTKIPAPKEDVAPDDDEFDKPPTAVLKEFNRIMLETHSGYVAPKATVKERSMAARLLEEYSVEDIVGLFDMVATRWAVVMENWPGLAKTPLPTFYATFTLRKHLVPLVQTGKGLTSRTHRYDPGAARPPAIGWGDE